MRSLTVFFGIAVGGMWLCQAPALLSRLGLLGGDPGAYVALAALGGFSPLVAALVACRVEGPGRVRMLLAGLRPRAAHLGPYLVALACFPALHVAGEAVYRLLGGAQPGAWWYPPTNAQQVTAALLIPFVEEIGWRGFAMPRLADRLGIRKASLVVGVAWAAWHAVMFVLQGFTPGVYAASMAMLLAASLVFGGLYARSGGSLVVAVLAHLGVHLDNPTHALGQDPTPYFVFVGAVVVAGLAVAARLPGSGRGVAGSSG